MPLLVEGCHFMCPAGISLINLSVCLFIPVSRSSLSHDTGLQEKQREGHQEKAETRLAVSLLSAPRLTWG
jgi:hypothetical protein